MAILCYPRLEYPSQYELRTNKLPTPVGRSVKHRGHPCSRTGMRRYSPGQYIFWHGLQLYFELMPSFRLIRIISGDFDDNHRLLCLQMLLAAGKQPKVRLQ